MAGTVTDQGTTLRVEGDWGSTQFSPASGTETLIDATGATWDSNNDGSASAYPFYVNAWGASNVALQGGSVFGSFSLTQAWGSLYAQGNAAAVFSKGTQIPHIHGWRIDGVWDGIRVTGGGTNYLIEDCWISRTRDDAFELDDGRPGTIRNCLIEDCFSGISITSKQELNTTANVVTVENVKLSLKSYLYNSEGDIEHQSPVKCSIYSPQVRITNSVLAISQVDHLGWGRLETFMSQLVTADSANNYYLNLSDTALLGNYPAIHSSFTVLQGQAARDHWATARAAYFGEAEPEPSTDSAITALVSINPTSGAIRTLTPESYAVTVTIGATNAYGSDTETVSITIGA